MRPLAMTLALGAAALLFIGTLTTGWWSHADGDLQASMGLQESRLCTGDTCRSGALRGMDADSQWIRAGTASYAGGFLAGGLLVAVLVTGLLRRGHELLIKTAMVACVSTLIAGVAFVWLAPEFPGMSPGYSMYAYFTGAALGIGAGMASLRLVGGLEVDPEAGADAQGER